MCSKHSCCPTLSPSTELQEQGFFKDKISSWRLKNILGQDSNTTGELGYLHCRKRKRHSLENHEKLTVLEGGSNFKYANISKISI